MDEDFYYRMREVFNLDMTKAEFESFVTFANTILLRIPEEKLRHLNDYVIEVSNHSGLLYLPTYAYMFFVIGALWQKNRASKLQALDKIWAKQ